jgi:hypothetical protein
MIHVEIDLHSRTMTLVTVNASGKLLAEEKLTKAPCQSEPVL